MTKTGLRTGLIWIDLWIRNLSKTFSREINSESFGLKIRIHSVWFELKTWFDLNPFDLNKKVCSDQYRTNRIESDWYPSIEAQKVSRDSSETNCGIVWNSSSTFGLNPFSKFSQSSVFNLIWWKLVDYQSKSIQARVDLNHIFYTNPDESGVKIIRIYSDRKFGFN